jgi:hypothetical protein
MVDLLIRADHCARCSRTPRNLIHCHRCGTDKPRSEFYRNRKGGPFAYHGGCKSCRAAQSAKWYRSTHGLPEPARKVPSANAIASTAAVMLDNHRVIRDGSVWFCPRCKRTWPYPQPLPTDTEPCTPRKWSE